jgi:hypothetical protein
MTQPGHATRFVVFLAGFGFALPDRPENPHVGHVAVAGLDLAAVQIFNVGFVGTHGT